MTWSIVPPLQNIIYDPVLLPVFGKPFQIESEKAINWFSVLILDYLNRSYKVASFISGYYFKAKVLFYLMYFNKCTNPSKSTIPGFYKNISNLCTAKLKSTIVD